MTETVLALNAGSSSVKFGLFDADNLAPIFKGFLEDRGEEPRLTVHDAKGAVLEDRRWRKGATQEEMFAHALDWIEHKIGAGALAGAGHRIVHGGRDFTSPIWLDDDAIAAVDRLTPLAPLHQPRGLQQVRALKALRPNLPQVACFDTAFHHTLSPLARRYALPSRYEEEGVRKYGFHGLSYEYIAGRLDEIDPTLAGKRAVVAHLGSGASLCALQHGRSLDTTMGFSTLDGLVMGTRPGALDPGALIYLQRAHGLKIDEIEHILYHESGLLGISGLSSDMRTLETSDDSRAKEAIDLFVFRVARETAALANTLGGLDLIVFTGGIGEHSPSLRAAVCERLRWLGVTIDPARNALSSPQIHADDSAIKIRVIPTNEELVVARQTVACLVGSDRKPGK